MKQQHPSIIYNFFLIIVLMLFGKYSFAQQEECLSSVLHKKLMTNNLVYANNFAKNESILKQTIAQIKSGNKSINNTTYRIPIVVHVIHLGEAVGSGTNISDAQIYSAMRTLNDAYRKKAGSPFDANGVDTQIEFCLAQKDPLGNSTTGIIRVDGSSTSDYATEGVTSSGTNNETMIKALSKWDNTKYYNVWIVSEIDGNDGGAGTQGYAYYPGAPASLDGTIILYNSFGYDPTGTLGYNLKSYTNYNITFIHEMGHALNLYHTFEGDGTGSACPSNSNCAIDGDEICDIPPHKRSTSTCLADNTVNPCQSGSTAADYQHNYMDYSSDDCQNMFSADQSTRMNAALTSGPRASLVTPTNLTNCGCDIPVVLFSASPTNPCPGMPVQFTDESLNFPTSWSWTLTGGSPASANTETPTSTYNTAGAYNVTLQVTTAGAVTKTVTKSAYINPVASATLPFTENFEAATFPPTGWASINPDAPDAGWGNLGAHGWERRPATGNTGSTNGCAAMDCYNYNLSGTQVDDLIMKPVSLMNMATSTMTFKVAYEHYPNSVNYDSLRVFVSTDCGNTFPDTVYANGGETLTTTGSSSGSSSQFTPSSASEWRTETVNLDAYVGQSIIIKFSSYSKYGNDMYLDDINITGTSAAASASISIISDDADDIICMGDTITFTATPTNGGTGPTYQWKVDGNNVGTGATYSTSTLTSGQAVTCIMTSNLSGVTNNPATSNTVTITVNPLPLINAGSDDTICSGDTVQLNASGGSVYLWSTGDLTSSVLFAPNDTATVSVIGTDVNGCSDSDSLMIFVTPLPTTPTITQNGLVLTSSASAGNQWYMNSSAISGETNQTYTVTQIGDYWVVVTESNCSSLPSDTINVLSTEVEEIKNSYNLNIYPNPNNGNFVINFNTISKGDYKITLTNMLGQIVYKDVVNDFEGSYSKQLNIAEYGKGIYTISLSNDKKETVRKIIVY